MIFASLAFLLYFFPVVFLVYHLLFFSRPLQNCWLLIASLLFYAWGEPVYVLIMIGSILANSLFGKLVTGRSSSAKRFWLVISAIANLSVLFVFKYLDFVLESLSIFGVPKIQTGLTLPIGISFFTFQAISYVVDCYRGDTTPENPFYVGLYIAFFPQLIAGPIVQFNSVADQIRNRRVNIDLIAIGVCRFTCGLAKKILLANTFSAIVDNIFSWSLIGSDKLQVPVMLAWVGSISYTLQIYYDFSGYSDMAIGLALMFGFEYSENFNYPYSADSMTDFWRRWHISLTDWFRDYVYIPLGGNRNRNQDMMVRNMFIVWLLTGIWHGANWTFIFWGLANFALILGERFIDYDKRVRNPIIRHVLCMLMVNFLWVIFRADNLYQAGIFLRNMLGTNNNGFYSDLAILYLRENAVFFIAGVIFAKPVARKFNERLFKFAGSVENVIFSVMYPFIMTFLLVICVSYLAMGTYNPFIYFNF